MFIPQFKEYMRFSKFSLFLYKQLNRRNVKILWSRFTHKKEKNVALLERASGIWRIGFYDADELFIILTRFGGVKSKEDMEYIFGPSQ